MKFADRLAPLQFNVFAAMDTAKAEAAAQGLDIVDLSLGSVDLPTPPHVLQAIADALDDPSTHGYQLFRNNAEFRRVVAQRYEQEFGISVDPETEVLSLIGSQEGTAHLPLAVMNPGDVALLGDPGYPSHYGGVHLAGGEIYPMALLAENQFLPDFSTIPQAIAQRSRLMVLNYPHNPTTATATIDFFQEAFSFCDHYDIILVHDFAYDQMVFGDQSHPSIFQVDREKKRSIEFFTLSKAFGMGGFRVGYGIGNRDLIKGLRQVKAAIDFNQYQGILRGAIASLTGDQTSVKERRDIFQQRRDAFVQAMADIGWEVPMPKATMFVWAKLPNPWETRSMEFCTQLVAKTGIAASAGCGFGKSGEGYVRFALVRSPKELQNAVQRIGEFLNA